MDQNPVLGHIPILSVLAYRRGNILSGWGWNQGQLRHPRERPRASGDSTLHWCCMRDFNLSRLIDAEVPAETNHNIGSLAQRASLDCGPLETCLCPACPFQDPHRNVSVSIPHLLPRVDWSEGTPSLADYVDLHVLLYRRPRDGRGLRSI